MANEVLIWCFVQGHDFWAWPKAQLDSSGLCSPRPAVPLSLACKFPGLVSCRQLPWTLCIPKDTKDKSSDLSLKPTWAKLSVLWAGLSLLFFKYSCLLGWNRQKTTQKGIILERYLIPHISRRKSVLFTLMPMNQQCVNECLLIPVNGKNISIWGKKTCCWKMSLLNW